MEMEGLEHQGGLPGTEPPALETLYRDCAGPPRLKSRPESIAVLSEEASPRGIHHA